ncbi:PadR family transcriptional regulator [Micromonospora sp. WMMD736]|uniref:PadR family transcriptional regulator n=1 Tax=Micromonospora sp. WMMD736 TaxID=3404112 RepID=UPI003B95E9E9
MVSPPPLREPTFLILTALAREPMHGYGIVSDVAALSGGRLALRPGTLYGALDRLTDEGLVERDHDEVVEGRLRRYYRLTEAGRSVLTAETERLRRNVEAASERLRTQHPRTPAVGVTARNPLHFPATTTAPMLRPAGGLA